MDLGLNRLGRLWLKAGGTMQNVMNRRWLLTGYPEGMPTLDNWVMDTQPVPARRASLTLMLLMDFGIRNKTCHSTL
jgi:hypothetical protein